MRLLVTRAEPDAKATAAALESLGHRPIVSPLTRVVGLPFKPLPEPSVYQAVVLTSRNAVKCLSEARFGDAFFSLPAFTVGERTADAARKAGFSNVRTAKGTANDLANLVIDECSPDAGPLLYLAGQERKPDLEKALTKANLSCDTQIVYAIETDLDLSEEAQDAFASNQLDGILVYSLRSGQVLLESLERHQVIPLPAAIALFCLSPEIAAHLRPYAQGEVRTAARPDEGHLFATLSDHRQG